MRASIRGTFPCGRSRPIFHHAFIANRLTCQHQMSSATCTGTSWSSASLCMATTWAFGQQLRNPQNRPMCLGAVSDLQEICSPVKLQKGFEQFTLLEAGGGAEAYVAFFRRLGCTTEQLTAAVGPLHEEPSLDDWPFAGTMQPQVYLYELLVAGLAAFALLAYQQRPRGWARTNMVEARSSPVQGSGLFASQAIPKDTVLGAYPGRPRTMEAMVQKVVDAPRAKAFAFQTGDGRFLDPTDDLGLPSKRPSPGLPWWDVECLLALVNEPPPGAGGPNVQVEDGETPLDLMFVASRDIQKDEEIFVDYGIHYDRSFYGQE